MAHSSNYIVHGKQRNHGSVYVPVSIRHLGDMPVFRMVAWWGLLLGREFTREDVSEAFHIEPRRASGILNYICNRHGEGDIVFLVNKPVRRGGGNTLKLVRILAVVQKQLPPSHKPVPVATRAAVTDCNQERLTARWFLSRPCGDNVERLAAWKSACPVSVVESC